MDFATDNGSIGTEAVALQIHQCWLSEHTDVRRISDLMRRQLGTITPHPPYWGEFAHLSDQWLLVDDATSHSTGRSYAWAFAGVRISNPALRPIANGIPCGA